MSRQLRIVKARTETPGEFRATAEKIPSPARDNVSEALNNPSQLNRRIKEQDLALQQRDIPTTKGRPADVPAPPSMTDYTKGAK
jgi:hypothetical protein